jgi:hypothetical protein
MASLLMEKALGSAYWAETWERRQAAKTSLSTSEVVMSSGRKSRQMCIDGMPRIVKGSNSFE